MNIDACKACLATSPTRTRREVERNPLLLPPITPNVLDEHVRRHLTPNDADAVLNDPLWGPSRDVITETFHNDLVDIGDMLRVIRNQIPAGAIREAVSPAAWLVGNLTSKA